jgi:hypothetical protein
MVLVQVILLVPWFSSVTISPPMHCTPSSSYYAHIKTRGQNLLIFIRSKTVSCIGELWKYKYCITCYGNGLCAKVVSG